jgi:hypothetical protein
MSKLPQIKSANKLLLGLILLALAFAGHGCSTNPNDPERYTSPNPWDHTEGWESGGPAGGLFQQH